jgi:nucleoside-diphosphate-sugar epimerase
MQLGTNMKILVTGGAGYVGSNLCNSLIKENHEVICLDNDFNQDYFIVRNPELQKHWAAN